MVSGSFCTGSRSIRFIVISCLTGNLRTCLVALLVSTKLLPRRDIAMSLLSNNESSIGSFEGKSVIRHKFVKKN